MLVPLFPLQLVLFPGVALPLHIFEPRYRLMVKRCLEGNQPFGVIRSGSDGLSEIGTLAEIREATRYVDGRWDIVTLGTQRFRIVNFDRSAAYLQAEIELLEEPIGEPAARVSELAQRVSDAFIDYLELLRGVDDGEHEHDHDDEDEGDEIESDEVTPESIDEALEEEQGAALSQEVVAEIERLLVASNAAAGPAKITEFGPDDDEGSDDDGDPDGELLATAIDRLSGSDDPVGLSHVVGGVVQLSIEQRQELLEAADARTRLTLLAAHLDRENLLLAEGIRPWNADASLLAERRN